MQKSKFKNQDYNSKAKIVLLLIILLAGFLRFWRLDQHPAGLNADEAAIGYNAYSLIRTGKDEHGNSWPIHFKSFGDYKPGLYFYLVLPFVKMLGLNIWAVRLPSAIFGVLGVLGIYLLAKNMFSPRQPACAGRLPNPSGLESSTRRVSPWRGVPLLSALLLAISPWHLHFSRGGWEANAGTLLMLIGVFGVFRGFRETKWLVVGGLWLVASLYTYHSARVIVPLLGLGLVLIYRKELVARLSGRGGKWLLSSGLIVFILLIPLARDFLGPAGASRFSGVGIFADQGPFWRVNEQRGEHQNWNSFWVRILHNRLISYGLSFLENWMDHFHGEFLFLSGDPIVRSRVPETGQLYLAEIPFVVLGIWFLLKTKTKSSQFVFWWLAIAPVAAALTFQTPHALRAHNMVIPLTIITAYGLGSVLRGLERRRAKGGKRDKKRLVVLLTSCSVVLLVWNFARYLHQYYVHYPQNYPEAWEYGFEELVDYIGDVQGQYEQIYVTDKYDQPYILFLFYLRYPPERFQREVVLTPRDKFGFSTVRSFGKFHFEEIDWEKVKNAPNALIIGTGQEIPDSAEIIKIINFPNGQPAFEIAKT